MCEKKKLFMLDKNTWIYLCTNKWAFVRFKIKSYIFDISIYKQDMALNNLQGFDKP